MRRVLIGITLTVVCLGLFIRLIDWPATARALQGADPWFTALAVVCLLLSIGAKTARWRLLLPRADSMTLPRLYRILHVSFLLNNVLPARLGDVARVAMTSRQPGVRLGHVVSSLFTERLTDVVTLVLGFLAVSPFLPLDQQYVPWLHAAWWTSVIGALAVLLLVVLRRQIAKAVRFDVDRLLPSRPRLREEARSFGEGWRQLFARDSIARIWAWSAAGWAGAFAINYMLMRALDIDAPLSVAVLLTCTTNLAMILPSSPGYVGVFHAAATLSLLPFGVGSSLAFSFAILAHLVNVVPVSLMGAAFLLWNRDGVTPGWLRREAFEPVVVAADEAPASDAPGTATPDREPVDSAVS